MRRYGISTFFGRLETTPLLSGQLPYRYAGMPLNSCKILVQIGLYCSLCNAWNLVSLLLGKSLKLVTPDQCNSSYGFLVTVRITVSNFCIFSYSYFLPARCYASTGNSDSNTCPSVRLSVRLSVTRRYCVKTRKLAAWFLQHLVAPTL